MLGGLGVRQLLIPGQLALVSYGLLIMWCHGDGGSRASYLHPFEPYTVDVLSIHLLSKQIHV